MLAHRLELLMLDLSLLLLPLLLRRLQLTNPLQHAHSAVETLGVLLSQDVERGLPLLGRDAAKLGEVVNQVIG